jgi:hypothetical protein
VTAIGKAMKKTYQCGNCQNLSRKFGKHGIMWCRALQRETSVRAGAGCQYHKREDIMREADRLTGPGRRGHARRSAA